MKKLSDINLKQEFVNHFQGDNSGSKKPRQTPGMFYSKVLPSPVAKVTLLGWSEALADTLGIEKPTATDDLDILGGNRLTASMQPYAACYGGHQFGSWAGQLGDGRAITLGEMQGSDETLWELQLKGPGPTPYSRRADGRAVLRSSVREYLMSEAMYHLGVPTTRALSLVSTGEAVMRDMFYDGHPQNEPGAIVLRVAPSFLRFGNFEIFSARGETKNLQRLVDWTISRFYPQYTGEDKIIAWYKEVVERTAALMVQWLRVGFVHGVMNTDNMSILGLTIDYGPYSVVDNYDLNFTPNTTDLPGRRYAFGRQGSVAKWNLGCLGGALAPLLPDSQPLVEVLDQYDAIFWEKYYRMLSDKLGLKHLSVNDTELMTALEKILASLQPDMTIFFQLLIDLVANINNYQDEDTATYFTESFYDELSVAQVQELQAWISRYRLRLKDNSPGIDSSVALMRATSPRFILRNYMLHNAIEALEGGDDTLFLQLQEAIKQPYSKEHDEFFKKRPGWATQKAGCSMLSCSS